MILIKLVRQVLHKRVDKQASKGSHLLLVTSLIRAGLGIPIRDASRRRFGRPSPARASATPPPKSLQEGPDFVPVNLVGFNVGPMRKGRVPFHSKSLSKGCISPYMTHVRVTINYLHILGSTSWPLLPSPPTTLGYDAMKS